MEQSTYLADCIDATEYESKYDSQAKNLTANKQVLAHISSILLRKDAVGTGRYRIYGR